MALPALPAVAEDAWLAQPGERAAAACAPPACRTLALFVQASQTPPRALSTLEGDAMPGDLGTRAFGRVEARTERLASELSLLSGGAFRIVAPNVTFVPGEVRFEARVYALDLRGGEYLLAESAADGLASWPGVIELAPDPPAWMERSDGTFVLPEGMRLGFELVGRSTPSSLVDDLPIAFELGHEDAPLRLEVESPTRGAYAMLAAGAEGILPGPHSGSFSNLTDVDHYAFHVPSGARVTIGRVPGADALFALRTPDGARVTSLAGAAGPSGTWILHVSRAPSNPVSEYRFDLGIGFPNVEEPSMEEGTVAGLLGATNEDDTFRFFAWRAQRVTLDLATTGTLGARLVLVEGALFDKTASATRMEGRSHHTEVIGVRVERLFGSGGYELTLDLDERGNLSGVPTLEDLWITGTFTPVGLSGYEGGVDVVFGFDALHVDESGPRVILENEPLAWATLRTADGSLVQGNLAIGERLTGEGHIGIYGPDGVVPLTTWYSHAAFGGDGALYARGPEEIRRVAADRTQMSFPLPAQRDHRLLAAPTGEVYLVEQNVDPHVLGPAWRIDPEARTLVRTPALDGVAAFDGAGGFYRILALTLVERVAPDGEIAIVAQSPNVLYELATTGTRLYATAFATFDLPASVQTIDLGLPGFEGFHPALDMPPPSNIHFVGFEDAGGAGGDALAPRTLRVTVGNSGGSAARGFEVAITLDCRASCTVNGWIDIAEVAELPAGATTTLDFVWDPAGHVGDQAFNVFLDRSFLLDLDDVPESDENDNFAEVDTHVLLTGNEAACEAGVLLLPDNTPLRNVDERTVCGNQRV